MYKYAYQSIMYKVNAGNNVNVQYLRIIFKQWHM